MNVIQTNIIYITEMYENNILFPFLIYFSFIPLSSSTTTSNKSLRGQLVTYLYN